LPQIVHFQIPSEFRNLNRCVQCIARFTAR
jgi:hypothetical protein